MDAPSDYRAILFHKQATSARLRFLRFDRGSVCAFESLPALSRVHGSTQDGVALHPAAAVRRLEAELGFETDSLRACEGYHFEVEVPGERIPVFLVEITSTDPPFSVAGKIGAQFIELTQARGGLPSVELELLRGAYELVLGG